jgi:flagellar assembly factor FliW
MKLVTPKFGALEIPDNDIITFPEGVPGFNSRRWVLFQREETPIVSWLQSIDEPEVSLMTVEPADLLLDYAPTFEDDDIRAVRPDPTLEENFEVRLIIRNAEIPNHLRVNLFAPLLFNVDRRLGMQVPLAGSDYPVSALWPPQPIK